jgi:cysteinyl-tRNA synthetase
MEAKELSLTMADDLNTPAVLTRVSAIANVVDANLVDETVMPSFVRLLHIIDELLGLTLAEEPDITDEQKQIINDRQAARGAKEWQKSDELRDQLKEQGIYLRDTEHGPIWYRS